VNSDPDPVSKVNPDTDTDPFRIQGFGDQKLKKKKIGTVQQKIFLIKNCNLLMSKLQEKHSAFKGEHPTLEKMKFINFFLCLWVIFAHLDPDSDTDPGTPLNPDSDTDPGGQKLPTAPLVRGKYRYNFLNINGSMARMK
jgi:hypothetical protein